MGKQKKKAKSANQSATIAVNRQARHNYIIEESIEAGLVLQGWEVKSLRAGKAQIAESYVIIKHNEAWILGSVITPLLSASTHVVAKSDSTRKLLLHKKEINKLAGITQQKGYTLVPLKLYWKKNKVKLELGVAKGKKDYDKRQTEKDRDWKRQKQQLFKKGV